MNMLPNIDLFYLCVYLVLEDLGASSSVIPKDRALLLEDERSQCSRTEYSDHPVIVQPGEQACINGINFSPLPSRVVFA